VNNYFVGILNSWIALPTKNRKLNVHRKFVDCPTHEKHEIKCHRKFVDCPTNEKQEIKCPSEINDVIVEPSDYLGEQ